MGIVPPVILDNIPHTAQNLVVALFEQMAELRRKVAAQSDEIAAAAATEPRTSGMEMQSQVEASKYPSGSASRSPERPAGTARPRN
jgi:hypothetical protein